MDHSHHHHETPAAGKIGVPVDGASMDHSNMAGHMGMGHGATFHFGGMETVLFDFWKTDGAGGIIVSSLILILLCFIMESVKFVRNYKKTQKALFSQQVIPAEDRLKFAPKFSISLLGDGVLHAVQISISYMLMLVFMTFNVWLCIAVVIGEVLARLFFAISFPYLGESSAVEHCG